MCVFWQGGEQGDAFPEAPQQTWPGRGWAGVWGPTCSPGLHTCRGHWSLEESLLGESKLQGLPERFWEKRQERRGSCGVPREKGREGTDGPFQRGMHPCC